jgi:branched-chain amino acid transport system substrate-binding protein
MGSGIRQGSALVAVFLGVLAGCDSGGGNGTCTTNADCGGEVCLPSGLCSNANAALPMTDCAVQVCEDVINIGNVSAQTGPTSNLGTEMVTGVRAAFYQANLRGGVDGRLVNLVVRDDGYEPVMTTPAMQELTSGGESRKVLAIVGNVGTPPAAVAIPIAEMNDTVFFGAFTGAGILRTNPPSRHVFNYRASYQQETAAIVRYLSESVPAGERVPPQNFGVLAQGNTAAAQDATALDPYGASGYNGVVDALAGVVAANEIPLASYMRNTADLDIAVEHFLRWLASDQVVVEGSSIRAAIVMVPTADPAAALVVGVQEALERARTGADPVGDLTAAQVTQLGMVDLTVASVSFVGSDRLRQNLTSQGMRFCESVMIGQVVPFPTGDSEAAIAYRAALDDFNVTTGQANTPGFVSFEGYLAGRLFIEGLEASSALTTDGLVSAFEGLTMPDLGTGAVLSLGPGDHQASDAVFLTGFDAGCRFTSIE